MLPYWTVGIFFAIFGALLSLAVVCAYYSRASIGLIGPLLLAFAVLVAWPIVSDLLHGCFDPLGSRNVFVYLFSLYAVSLPLLTYLRGESVSEVATTRAIAKAFAITVLSLIFFLLGYRSRTAIRISSSLPLIGQVSIQRLQLATLIIITAVALWFALFLYSIGGLGIFLQTGYADIYELEQGKEYLGFSLTLIPTCVLLLFHVANRTRSRIVWLAVALSLAGTIVLLLSGSRRRLLITLVLSLLVYCHYAIRRISTKILLTLTFVGAVAVSSLGLLRSIPPEELASRQTVQFLAEQSPSQLFYTFLEIGEPATNFETFPFIVDEISNGMPFQWGKTYLEAPLVLIPRVLYPGRPLTASQWYVSKFFPDVEAQFGGRPLFFLGEAYLNFGVMGPPALMLLVGIGCRIVYSYLERNKFTAESVLIYAAILGCIPTAIRIDFATTLKVLLGSTLPLILLVVWHSRANRGLSRVHFRMVHSGGSHGDLGHNLQQ